MRSGADTATFAMWQETCRLYGSAEPAIRRVFSELAASYSGADRFYHTLGHVIAMLGTLDTLRTQTPIPNINAVRLAVWFHDAVYDTRAGDNEERSAAYASRTLPTLGVPDAETAAAARLILSTKAHQAPTEDADGAALLDADLAILGAAVAEYDRYAQDIRREYAWVAEDDWRAGRSKVLRSFAQRERIYRTPPMFQSLEDRARRNLQSELDALA